MPSCNPPSGVSSTFSEALRTRTPHSRSISSASMIAHALAQVGSLIFPLSNFEM